MQDKSYTLFKSILLLVVLGSVVSCATAPNRPDEPGVSVTGIDHVILGVADLDQGVNQLEELTGVRAIRGGLHPQYGTHNALVATGPAQYIEILAPAPGQTLAPFLEPLRSLNTLTPVAWVVTTEDADAALQWLTTHGFAMLSPTPGSRPQPDGSLLTWTIISPNPAVNPVVPTFIEWGPEIVHPASFLPHLGTLSAIELRTPAPERLQELLDKTDLPVSVVRSPMPAISLEIATQRGRVRF